MTKKKLFILDSGDTKIRLLFKKYEEELEIKETTDPIWLRGNGKLPRDYDAYILHLSDINFRDLEDLRKEQPWSWIYGISGAGRAFLSDDLRVNFDRLFYLVSRFDAESIEKELRSYREEKGSRAQ